jgi:hypothetical protein
VSFEMKKNKKITVSFRLRVFRGGAQGIDEGIFPAQMEIDWVYFYQRR